MTKGFTFTDESMIAALDDHAVLVCTLWAKAREIDDLPDPRLDGARVCVWPTGEVDRVGEA